MANRSGILLASLVAASFIGASTLKIAPGLAIWNPTASVPRGLYIRASSPASRGEFVLAWLPPEACELAQTRGYLPRSVPALKPLAGLPGDTVCASGESITVNGHAIASRRFVDHLGREMPWWEGCQTLHSDQVFLLSTYALDSFDGRYFGPSKTSDVIEKVTPVWTFP